MAKLNKWQVEFIGEIKEMTNRELYDSHIAMLSKTFEFYSAKAVDRAWQIEKIEAELDYRLKDWFVHDNEVTWETDADSYEHCDDAFSYVHDYAPTEY